MDQGACTAPVSKATFSVGSDHTLWNWLGVLSHDDTHGCALSLLVAIASFVAYSVVHGVSG